MLGEAMSELKTSKYVVQTLQDPAMPSKEFKEMYERFAKRILWIDDDVVPGAFQMNTSWYKNVPEINPVFPEHAHDSDEIIGFFGSDPEDPYDLNAELEVWIDGERHIIDKSTLIFVPAGLKHMPLKINYIETPVFHFSVVTGKKYGNEAYGNRSE
jgi:hypothetical protein